MNDHLIPAPHQGRKRKRVKNEHKYFSAIFIVLLLISLYLFVCTLHTRLNSTLNAHVYQTVMQFEANNLIIIIFNSFSALHSLVKLLKRTQTFNSITIHIEAQ